MYFSQAKLDEGWVPRVYKNYKGLPTLGYGHLVTPDTHRSLTSIGVSKERAQRLLFPKPGKRDVALTVAEGEALLRHDIAKKERELRYMLAGGYDKLTNDQKTGLIGLRFRGDFAMYDDPRTRKQLSREYRHARAGRYDLAAKAMRRRVKDAPLGVRKRVERHTEPFLATKSAARLRRPGLTTAAIVAAAAAGAALWWKRRAKQHVVSHTPPVKVVARMQPKTTVVTHALMNNTPRPCPPGKTRNPETGRCVKQCPPDKTRNPRTGRCVKKKHLNKKNTRD
jgi:GH24 family phage-related lysozyme (muramidase)